MAISLKHFSGMLLLSAALLGSGPALGGITYKLEQAHASAGETVDITAVLFNDGDNALEYTAPKNLVVQWRNQNGQPIRSLAYLAGGGGSVTVPVNTFVKLAWKAVVPSTVHGLQAVNIEGTPTMLALDTSPLDKSAIAGTAADVPVVDAGAARVQGQTDPVLPTNVVVAAGASPNQGPAPNNSVAMASSSSDGFDRFRNAISPYEPIYFDAGRNHGRTDARFQISFKYRLFQPKDPINPDFIDNFYLGYTQTSLWDLSAESHPFVDTSFKPSLFWRKDALFFSPEKSAFLGLATGVEHESNGKDGDDSRAINFGYIQPEFNYRFDGGGTLTFAPKIKAYFGSGDKNPDYADYAGHVDWKLRFAQDNGLVLSGLYRQGTAGRNSTQIEAAWPLRRTFLNMNGYLHVQYFKGYGETILGYNQKVGSQFRVGLALIP
ncbi:phospholipase A [Pusillimonas sp. ANT_WB101]|uniref:phospholipase A n=1 Tax=Pusillimonas sp. ANT_WB101 TaxID=2597356 RepID=UPI0011EFED4D|nr:phospholipase A [Pusillimonas sp. ANT_WB101]KAA0910371.1 phospholipase [Pusillimonas sp. ANT_WB101]